MAAVDYVKQDSVNLGHKLGDLINGVREGIDIADFNALIESFTAGLAAVNEAKDVPAAFGLHVVSGLSDKVGDKFVEDALAAEIAAEGGDASG